MWILILEQLLHHLQEGLYKQIQCLGMASHQ